MRNIDWSIDWLVFNATIIIIVVFSGWSEFYLWRNPDYPNHRTSVDNFGRKANNPSHLRFKSTRPPTWWIWTYKFWQATDTHDTLGALLRRLGRRDLLFIILITKMVDYFLTWFFLFLFCVTYIGILSNVYQMCN